MNEYITTAFNKIGERMDIFFFKDSKDNLPQSPQRNSNFEKYENFYENVPKKQESRKNIETNVDFNDFIEKAHELDRSNDPKNIYTEFRKKKNKEKIMIKEERNSFFNRNGIGSEEV